MEDLLHYLAESLGNVNAGSYATQTVSSGSVTLSSGATLQAAPADGDITTKIPTTSWVKENAIHIGTTPPSPAVAGQFWLDTTAESGGFKYNSGTSASPSWSPVSVAGLSNLLLSGATTVEDLSFDGQRKFLLPAGTDAEFTTYFTTNGTTLETGMLRFNTTTAKLQVYTGSSWESLSPNVTITTASVKRNHHYGNTIAGDNLDWRLWYRSSSAVKFANNYATGHFKSYAYQNLTWRLNDDYFMEYPDNVQVKDRFGWGFSGGQIPCAFGRGSWLSATGQVYHYGSAAFNVNGYAACDHGLMATGRDRYTNGVYADEAQPAKVKRNSWDIMLAVQGSGYGGYYAERLYDYSKKLSTNTVDPPDDWFAPHTRVPGSESNAANYVDLMHVYGYDWIHSNSINSQNANRINHGNIGPYPKFVKYWVGETTAYYLCTAGKLWFSGNVSNGNAGNGTNPTESTMVGQPYVSQVPFFAPTLPGINPTVPLLGDAYPEIVHFCSTGMGEGWQADASSPGGGVYSNRTQTNYALDKEGYVYSWGWNRYGQLGDGSNKQANPTAQSTNAYARRIDPSRFGGKKIRYITCSGGSYGYVFAIDEDHKVWGWGNNAQGQLGLPNNNAYYDTPQPISSLNSGANLDFSNANIEYILPCKAHQNTHANTFFVDSEGNIYVTGTSIDYGVYIGVANKVQNTVITVPTRLRAVSGYLNASNTGVYSTLGNGVNGFKDYVRGSVCSLYTSGGVYGAMYAVVHHTEEYNGAAGTTVTLYNNTHKMPSGTFSLWSWGGNQSGILGRSTNYTAPTSYVNEAFGPGSPDGATLSDGPFKLSTMWRWGVPFPVKFWDRGSPDLGGGTGFSQSGPGNTLESTKHSDSPTGTNWYHESYLDRWGTNPVVSGGWGTTDEYQMPSPSFGQYGYSASNVPYIGSKGYRGTRPFGNICAVYGNGNGLSTNITVVLMNNTGNLFWAGFAGVNGTNLLASCMDPYSDGGWDTGMGTDTQVVTNGTSNGDYHQVYNYATSTLSTTNPYFQMFTMQPEPIVDFWWLSPTSSTQYTTTADTGLAAAGSRFQALGVSGTVYVTSPVTSNMYTTCNARAANYFDAIAKTTPIMNVGFSDRTNLNRNSY